MTATKQVLAERLHFTSCIKDDVWHPKSNPKAYEWFYFDALSDNGREALFITFFDNFIFSPRYNSNHRDYKIPALMFCYYRDGKPLVRAINEFPESDLSFSEEDRICRLSNNSFKFDSAPYGKGFLIEINTTFHKNKKLEAKLEWLFIDSDFNSTQSQVSENLHYWNLVAPRADVTGHIKVSDKSNKLLDLTHFRGTGYHDHRFDSRWLPNSISEWHWGRAHFADSTAIFYSSQEIGAVEPTNKLYVIKNGELRQRTAQLETQGFSRDILGLKFPNRFRLISEDNMRLRVKKTNVIDSNFFFVRYLSEMTLTLRDGKPRKSIGIVEHLATKKLTYRWLDWLVDLRIGKGGKASFLG